jgi:hypothetical protein
VCAGSGKVTEDAQGCPRLLRELVSDREYLPVADDGGHLQSGADASALVVSYPYDGLRAIVDPLLPREQQQILLELEPVGEQIQRVRWELDEEVIGEVTAPFSLRWTLQPGRHSLRALAVSSSGETTKASRPVKFDVEEL